MATGAPAAAALASIDQMHDDFDLPTALPAEVASSQEEVFASKQHYVASWAEDAAVQAAATAAAAAAAVTAGEQHPEVFSDRVASETDAGGDKSGPQEGQLPPRYCTAPYGSKDGSSAAVVVSPGAPIVVKGFVVQQNGSGAKDATDADVADGE